MKHSIPQEEWISSIRALNHVLNEKAKSFAVTFFNGDVKVFHSGSDKEVLSVKSLHDADSMIKDSLFLRNDLLNKKLLITCSSAPNAELKVSEVIKSDKRDYSFMQIAQSKAEEVPQDGFSYLSANPLNNEFFCSGALLSNDTERAL